MKDIAPAFSDEALALRFAELHAPDLRYVAEIGRWYIWDGKRWQSDRKLLGFNNARRICRAAARECNEPIYRLRGLTSAKTVAAVEKLARSDQRLAATIDQWDADSWLLNTPNGVIDLRTGKLRKHLPEDHMTKITAVSADPSCGITIWLNFLERVTNKNKELQAYLQRMLGYALTGDTSEHALFFIYGPGANGKSVLIETILGIIGDYGLTSPIETFTSSDIDRHPTELARLHGARLVTATETEEGRRWAESRIKMLTGGDRVSARFMRQDFFQYVPQFKLVIVGNHKPGLRSVNEATKRRVNMIPFDVVIPLSERLKDMAKQLKREWPGILAWLIEGCIDWRKGGGLDAPKVVTEATDHYFEQQDLFTAWMEEACERVPHAWTSRKEAFESWSWWTYRGKESCGTRPDFYQKLEDQGFKEAVMHGTRGFKGLRIKPL